MNKVSVLHALLCRRIIFTALLEVVEKELFKDDDAFEPLLSHLQSYLCSHPYAIDPVPMIDFYRIRHTYCKCEQKQ
jgi:hypothetical protein